MSDEQRGQLAAWLRDGVPTPSGISATFEDVARRIGSEWNIPVGRTTLSDYYRTHVAPAALEAAKAQRSIEQARFAGAVRAVRVSQGLTIEQVRLAAGLPVASILNAEAGEWETPPAEVRAIELALGVPPGWFVRALYAEAPRDSGQSQSAGDSSRAPSEAGLGDPGTAVARPVPGRCTARL